MLENLIKSNPKYADAWKTAQSIASKGGNQQEVIKNLCKQYNVDYNQVENLMKYLG